MGSLPEFSNEMTMVIAGTFIPFLEHFSNSRITVFLRHYPHLNSLSLICLVAKVLKTGEHR